MPHVQLRAELTVLPHISSFWQPFPGDDLPSTSTKESPWMPLFPFPPQSSHDPHCKSSLQVPLSFLLSDSFSGWLAPLLLPLCPFHIESLPCSQKSFPRMHTWIPAAFRTVQTLYRNNPSALLRPRLLLCCSLPPLSHFPLICRHLCTLSPFSSPLHEPFSTYAFLSYLLQVHSVSGTHTWYVPPRNPFLAILILSWVTDPSYTPIHYTVWEYLSHCVIFACSSVWLPTYSVNSMTVKPLVLLLTTVYQHLRAQPGTQQMLNIFVGFLTFLIQYAFLLTTDGAVERRFSYPSDSSKMSYLNSNIGHNLLFQCIYVSYITCIDICSCIWCHWKTEILGRRPFLFYFLC